MADVATSVDPVATASAQVDRNLDAEEEEQPYNHADDSGAEDIALSSDEEPIAGDGATLDNAMMNELLLVCSNLGMLRVENEGEEPVVLRSEDCEEWVHDLQRAIRRDDARTKLVAKQLGKWKILQKKLLPLLVNHQHDRALVFSLLKVLVMLTMKPDKDSTNVAQQLRYLRAYKYAFLQQKVLSVLMNLLLEPLSKRNSARTSEDYLNMELVLTLVRNLLAVPNEHPSAVTSGTIYLSHVHEDLICALHEESAYEMILLFAQDMDSAENREWDLLVMEILDLTLDASTPENVMHFVKSQSTHNQPKKKGLMDNLEQEKAGHKPTARRHSNFGGVIALKGPTGRNTVLTDFSKSGGPNQMPEAPKKPLQKARGRRRRDAPAPEFDQVFHSSEKTSSSDTKTMRVLLEICDSVLKKSYFQLTTCLKTEFRRGSSKLVATDRLQYFHLIYFFTSFHRQRTHHLRSTYQKQCRQCEKDGRAKPPAPALNETSILSTLDMFSFNFVLQSIESYASMKNHHGMTIAVRLLTEMLAFLSDLTVSGDAKAQRIADSLQHKLLYERDFLDRLPVLLKSWTPGLFPQSYVHDVVTLTHLVFKVLDAQGSIKVLSRRKKYLAKDHEEEEEDKAQLLMEMQRKEAEFDLGRYFLSFLSFDTIKMYTHLLQSYRTNGPRLNHFIHAFFHRVKHFRIYKEEQHTMEPLLFNLRLLSTFNRMLQDTWVTSQRDMQPFLTFIKQVVSSFFALADKNRLLFVESFLRQPYAKTSCLQMQTSYLPTDTMRRSKAEAVALGRKEELDRLGEIRKQKIQADQKELEGEAEVDFTLQPEDFSSSLMRFRDDEEIIDQDGQEEAVTASFASRLPKKSVKGGRAQTWTKVEDRYLAKAYQKYKHLPSVYEVLSYEDMFQDRDRTPEQIERRVKMLKLHKKEGEEEEEEEEEEESQAQSKPRRRLKRALDGDSSEDEDDILRDVMERANIASGSTLVSSRKRGRDVLEEDMSPSKRLRDARNDAEIEAPTQVDNDAPNEPVQEHSMETMERDTDMHADDVQDKSTRYLTRTSLDNIPDQVPPSNEQQS